jgi:hypothetical protein
MVCLVAKNSGKGFTYLVEKITLRSVYTNSDFCFVQHDATEGTLIGLVLIWSRDTVPHENNCSCKRTDGQNAAVEQEPEF